MKSPTFSRLALILGLMSFGGTTGAAELCGLPLPCGDTVSSGDPAFSITNNGSGLAGWFKIDNPRNDKPALTGSTNSSFGRAAGVLGSGPSRGVVGLGRSPDSVGVFGEGRGVGVSGRGIDGVGVQGVGKDTGIYGRTAGGKGVFGETTGPTGGIGVHGKSNSRGIVGTQGETSCAGTYAVGGCATTGNGVFGRAGGGIGVWGSSEKRALVGTQGRTSCAGVYAVGGCATSGDGVFGRSRGGGAGRFDGNVLVEGNMS